MLRGGKQAFLSNPHACKARVKRSFRFLFEALAFHAEGANFSPWSPGLAAVRSSRRGIRAAASRCRLESATPLSALPLRTPCHVSRIVPCQQGHAMSAHKQDGQAHQRSRPLNILESAAESVAERLCLHTAQAPPSGRPEKTPVSPSSVHVTGLLPHKLSRNALRSILN